MEIRNMNIGDYKSVYKLWLKTPGICIRNLDDSEEGIAKLLKRNPATNFVAVIDGEIVGVVLCGHDGRRASIYHASVDNSYQGRGIGTKLMDLVFRSLEKQGITKVNLLVFKDNKDGKKFWKEKGFKERDEISCFSKSLRPKMTIYNGLRSEK